MPISITRRGGDKGERIAWLCDDDWRLPDQSEALECWLRENKSKLTPGEYVADIGFHMREDALGGGAAFSPEALRIMGELGMSLFISEYPG
jgi:hypothetical protein